MPSECPFKKQHLRVAKEGFCSALDVDDYLKAYGEKYIACELHTKRVIAGALFESIEYNECVGESKCPIFRGGLK